MDVSTPAYGCRQCCLVHAGEELTIDYGWPAEVAIPCLCGSRHCRGWIVDPDEVELLSGERSC